MAWNYNELKINISEATELLYTLYGIEGNLSELPGDVDFNFRVRVNHGNGYILKISRPNQDQDYLHFQQAILLHLEGYPEITAPQTIKSNDGATTSECKDQNGRLRNIRLLTWILGRLWSSVNPQVNDLRFSLGMECGKLTQALQKFDHPEAHRSFEWDIAESLWTQDHLHLFESEKKEILYYFQSLFEENQQSYKTLRKSVVHNDPNDNNILVSSDLINPKVTAVIDFGDAVYTQTINDLAIACAYSHDATPRPFRSFLSCC